jgi:hypothetical protein
VAGHDQRDLGKQDQEQRRPPAGRRSSERSRRPDGPARPPSALAGIFRVPDGEPVHALLAHIASLTPGERLWFQHAVVADDLVLAPHERLDDGTPAALQSTA